jgi:hypothetical protein
MNQSLIYYKDKSIYANLLIDKGDFDKAVEIKSEKYVENKLYSKSDYRFIIFTHFFFR